MNAHENLRAALDQHFDEGLELPGALARAIAADPELAQYWNELQSLDRSLADLPLERPVPGLSQRINAQITVEAARSASNLQAAVGAFGLVAIAAIIIGFLYPVAFDPFQWSQSASSWVTRMDVAGMSSAIGESTITAWSDIATWAGNTLPWSNWSLAIALAAALAALAGFNGVEAARMRYAGSHTQNRRRDR
jgi:hypothetical protein